MLRKVRKSRAFVRPSVSEIPGFKPKFPNRPGSLSRFPRKWSFCESKSGDWFDLSLSGEGDEIRTSKFHFRVQVLRRTTSGWYDAGMRRRDFIAGMAGSVAPWPIVRAQQPGKIYRLGQ